MADKITRDDLYSPVPRNDSSAAMDIDREAKAMIDPAAVAPMDPSYRIDGEAFWDDTDPGHYLAFKLYHIEKELLPDDADQFDNRLYFKHPLDWHRYPVPTGVAPAPPRALSSGGSATAGESAGDAEQDAAFAFSKTVKLVRLGSSAMDDDEKSRRQLANLEYAPEDLAGFKRDRDLSGLSDERARAELDTFHNKPV